VVKEEEGRGRGGMIEWWRECGLAEEI